MTSTATARRPWPTVSSSSTRSRPSSGSGPCPAPAAKASGQRAERERPLAHRRGEQHGDGLARALVQDQDEGDDELGHLRGQRHQPLDEQVRADADGRPREQHGVGERLGGDEHREAEKSMMPADPAAALALGSLPSSRRHADEVRGLGRAGRHAAQVEGVEAEQDDGVGPGQMPAQDDERRVQGGGRDDREVDALLGDSSTICEARPSAAASTSDAMAGIPTAKLSSSRVLPVRLAVTNSTRPLNAK